jgi:XTP/dITP diphosphohydrolase
MELVFATNNKNKIEEVRPLLKKDIKLVSLKEIGCHEELPETGNTLEINASQKAKYVFDKYHVNCFADDTGLEIESLDGRPGVYSARYAGEERNAERNMEKVLKELENATNRSACFKTTISLIINGQELLFEGKVNGAISSAKQGAKGFGYDPIFIPDGFKKSFAEMTLEEKNTISHRALAVRKLTQFLNTLKS